MTSDTWIKSICVVTFDEELGQKLESQHPEIFNEDQQLALAFLAFPDSNSCTKIGDLSYTFRLKAEKLFGFVFFRQKREAKNKRGFSQKSIILMTDHPFMSLFIRVCQILGNSYFEHGDSVIPQA